MFDDDEDEFGLGAAAVVNGGRLGVEPIGGRDSRGVTMIASEGSIGFVLL